MLSYGLKNSKEELVYLSISEFDGSTHELVDWIRTHNLGADNFSTSTIIWDEARAALIPEAFYLESKKELLAKTIFETQINEHLLSENIEKNIILYPVQQELYYSIRSKLAKAEHKSIFAENIRFCLKNEQYKHGINVFFGNAYLQIIHCEDGQLQFANSFPFSSDNEAAYFILNYFEQSKLDRNTTPLACIGIDPKSEICLLLSKYLAKLNFHSASLEEELNKQSESHPFILSF